MATLGIGHFDEQGNACLNFHLCGVRHKEPGLKYIGIIDTGFTGFIQIPIQHAFSLRLPLEGTTTVTLADGSSLAVLTALGRATLLERAEIGVVMLSVSSNEILLGMDFLRRFKRALLVSHTNGVVLVDDFPAPPPPTEGRRPAVKLSI